MVYLQALFGTEPQVSAVENGVANNFQLDRLALPPAKCVCCQGSRGMNGLEFPQPFLSVPAAIVGLDHLRCDTSDKIQSCIGYISICIMGQARLLPQRNFDSVCHAHLDRSRVVLAFLFFLPEVLEVEGELAMMLDGQEDDLVVAHKIEDEMIAHQAFAQIIVLLQ